MQCFYTYLSIETCKEIFFSKVKLKRFSPSYGMGILMPNGFVGGIENEMFWIQKLSPRFFNLPARKFCGRFIQCEIGTKIEGGFRFLRLFKYGLLMFQAMVLYVVGKDILDVAIEMLKLNRLNFSNIIPYLLIMLLFSSIVWGICFLSVLTYKKEEKMVIDFIISEFSVTECERLTKS